MRREKGLPPRRAKENILRSDEAQTARAGLLNSAAGLLSFVSGMLLMPIISQILPADDLGKAMSYASIREIAFMVLSLSIAHSVSLAMIDYREKKYEYISSIFLFSGGGIILIFLILLPFKRYVLFLFYGSSFLFYWFFLMLLLQLAMEIMIFYVSFHNRYVISFCIIFLTNTLALIVSILLILNLGIDKYISRIIGIDFYIFVIGAVSLAVIIARGRLKFSLEHVRYGLKISLPLVPYTVATIVLMRSDILVTSYFGSPDMAGVYSMAFTIANILFVILQQIAKSWSPWVYRKLNAEEITTVHLSSKHLIILSLLAGAGLMTVTPELVRLFIHEEYYGSVLLTCPLVSAMFFRFLNLLYYDVEYFHKKNLFNGVSHAVAAAANIFLDVFLINVFGFSWCAVSTTICFGLLTLVHHIYARRIEKRKIYDTRYIFFCSAATIILSLAITASLDNWPVRYGVLLLVTAAAAYLERGLIRGALAKIRHGG